jgi:hypothetical protein
MFSTASMPRCGRTLALGLISLLIVAALHAQSPPDASPANTLHLYARLVELPTLVLRPNNLPLTSLEAKNVNIRIDLFPPFHPSSLRLEGNDPISLAILLDTRQQPALLPPFQAAFSAWLSNSFLPHDRISLYAMNCHLMESARDQPPNPALLQPILDSLVTKSEADSTRSHAACPHPVGSRNSIEWVMRKLAPLPGRHVLLILATNGGDDEGSLEWSDLFSNATLYAVTIFEMNAFDPAYLTYRPTLNQWVRHLDVLSADSGGMYAAPPLPLVPNTLAQFIRWLRGRYILQFPMPPNLDGNVHHSYVTINKTAAIVRPSGITVPLIDPSTHTGPVNIPVGEPSATPTQPQTTPPPPPDPNN